MTNNSGSIEFYFFPGWLICSFLVIFLPETRHHITNFNHVLLLLSHLYLFLILFQFTLFLFGGLTIQLLLVLQVNFVYLRNWSFMTLLVCSLGKFYHLVNRSSRKLSPSLGQSLLFVDINQVLILSYQYLTPPFDFADAVYPHSQVVIMLGL